MLIALVHVLAVLIIWFSSLPSWICLLFDVAIIGHWYFFSRNYLLSDTCILVRKDEAWFLILKDEKIHLELLGESFVSTFLVLFKAKSEEGKVFDFLLFKGNTTTNELRQLRVSLKYS